MAIVRRVDGKRGRLHGLWLAQGDHRQGYKTVSLWRDNRGRRYLVHRVVVEAFHGSIPRGMEVNHLNGDKHDNRLVNLELVLRQANIDHAVATGLIDNKGERNSQAKLNARDVRLIRAEHESGMGYKRIARTFGVTWETIRDIVKRQTWRHIE